MSFEVEGKLIKKFDTENKTETFQAREFVIEIESGNYPQMIKFQLTQDRCALVDNYEEGQAIKVHFDLRGREWNGRYFTNLNAWRIEKPVVNVPATEATAPQENFSFPSATDEPSGDMDGNDDLPF